MSPRWVSSNGSDGNRTNFVFNGAGNVSKINDNGNVNIAPADGSLGGNWSQSGAAGVPIQTWQTTPYVWHTQTYSIVPNKPFPSYSSMTDTDGHAINWYTDGLGHIVMTGVWTGSSEGLWLTTEQGWDGNNNLISTTDARGNETDYRYDAAGNAIEVALPAVTDTALSSVRPTSLYSYDPTTNNLVSYCSPKESHALGLDWPAKLTSPDTSCPYNTGSGASNSTSYGYDTTIPPTNPEPFGRLTNIWKPLGYAYTITYDSGGSDFGLPIKVQGQVITQAWDSTQRTPTQNFTYDAYGNLTNYDNAVSSWVLSYDYLNRLVTKQDAAGHLWYTCYYPDDSVFYSETPAQHGYDGGGSATGPAACPTYSLGATPPRYADSQTYDQDGDAITEMRQYMRGPEVPSNFVETATGINSVKTSYYDGYDRLVEVRQPYDRATDVYQFPWLTRYVYDIPAPHASSGPSTVTVAGTWSGLAYGQLYKTQECLPSVTTTVVSPNSPDYGNQCTFEDVRGNTFDAVNRAVAKYEAAFGSTAQSTSYYDQDNGSLGLLSKTIVATGQFAHFTYDEAGRLLEKNYDHPAITPTEQYTYDLDGHVGSITSSLFGTETYKFDLDGNLKEKDEPTSLSSYSYPGTITYTYYGDGKRGTLGLNIPGTTINSQSLLQYSYGGDGQLAHERVNAANSYDYTWGYTSTGKLKWQQDPSYESTISVTNTAANGQTTTSSVIVARKSYSYDQYGRISGLSMPVPGYGFGGFLYDAEGETLADNPSLVQTSPQHLYSIRGEEVFESQPPPSRYEGGLGAPTPALSRVTANGAVCPNYCSVDNRSGQTLSQNAYDPAEQPTFDNYHYDAAGRNLSKDIHCVASTNNTYTGVNATLSTGSTPQYDAENRTIATVVTQEGISDPSSGQYGTSCNVDPNLTSTASLAWGPSGHPYNSGNHWDGDSLLYESGNSTTGKPWILLHLGFVGEIWLATGGQSPPSDALTNDRDYNGLQYQVHNSGGYTAWSPPGAGMQITSAKLGFQVISVGQPSWGQGAAMFDAGISAATRADGYQFPHASLLTGTTIQGVRAYDVTSNQWTTPDAFSGVVHDPASQKPFMWNGNNPVSYADPSGYLIDWSQESQEAHDDWDAVKQHFQDIGDTDAVNAMNDVETKGPLITLVISSSLDIGTDEFNYDKDATPSTKGGPTITWNPNLSLANYPGSHGNEVLSPADSLLHETGHALDWINDPKKFGDEMPLSDDQFDSPLERNAIKLENQALKLESKDPLTAHTGNPTPCFTSSLFATHC